MIICDLDGTLFDNRHRANLIPCDKTKPEHWRLFNEACVDDAPVMQVINFVKYLARQTSKKQITFVTGRAEYARKQTALQLVEHFAAFDCKLFMRQNHDGRSNMEVKRGVLHQLSNKFDDANYFFEDDGSVINMARIHFPQLFIVPVPSYDITVAGVA